MKLIKKLLFMFAVVVVAGCNPTMNRVDNNVDAESEPVVNTVIVDLDAVSKASGQDEIISEKMKAVNADLTLQLGDIVTSFNKQLADQKKKFGVDISIEEQQKLQEMLIKANQLLAQKQTEANLKAQQYKEGLIKKWRDKIQPLVKAIADKKHATVVLVKSSSVMWFDSAIDITDEMIASLREKPISNSDDKDKIRLPIGSGDVI